MDIFDEISKEVDQERFLMAMKKYSSHLMCLVLLIIAGVVLYNWNQKNNRDLAEKQSYLYYQALQKRDNSFAELDQIISDGKGLAAIATLKKAAILSHMGKDIEARALYEGLEKQESNNPAIWSIASFLRAGMGIDKSPAESLLAFQALSKNARNVFLESTLLYEALLLYKDGKMVESSKILNKLNQQANLHKSFKMKVEVLLSLTNSSKTIN